MRSLRKHPKSRQSVCIRCEKGNHLRLSAAVARSLGVLQKCGSIITPILHGQSNADAVLGSCISAGRRNGVCGISRDRWRTIVGWREDFDMALKSPIPSQTAARLYLRHIAEYTGDAPLMIGGHSKGGNEAVFAAMETEPQIQDRIRAVYCFDGPGFREDIYRKKVILDRKEDHQNGSAGFLCGHASAYCGSYQVVESSGKGVLQHDMFTWVVKRRGFCIQRRD